MRSHKVSSACECAKALADQIEHVCDTLGLGPPTQRLADQIRFRRKGSLAVWVKGQSRGRFADFEAEAYGDALSLVAHLRCCSIREAMDWAEPFIIGQHSPDAAPSGTRFVETSRGSFEVKRQRRIAAARLWREAVTINGSAAAVYLDSRCGGAPSHDVSSVLRFHPSAHADGQAWPAMIALMTDPVTNEPTGVHRTFLNFDGRKAKPGKRMLGGKGVIRLWPEEWITDGLHIAEGIETALSAANLYNLSPIWACGDAGGVAKFPVLPGVEALTVIADHDVESRTGQHAAEQVCDRWIRADREAGYLIPKRAGDFADLVEEGGHAA